MPLEFAIAIALCFQAPLAAEADGNTRIDLCPAGFSWTKGENLSGPYFGRTGMLVDSGLLNSAFVQPDTMDSSFLGLFAPAGRQTKPMSNPFEPDAMSWIPHQAGGVPALGQFVPPPMPFLLGAALGAASIFAIERSAPPAKAKPNRLW
jgi:hypothetical protein